MLVARPNRNTLETFGPPFASGGEAKLFVVGKTHAAKIYDQRSDEVRRERCEAWFENPPFDVPTPDGRVKFAVPEEPLTDPASGEFVGYLMWLVRDPVKLVLLIDPGSDKFQTLAVRTTIAWRLALILAELEKHSLNPIFADLNDENVLVGPKGHPTLIDNDSHQVTNGSGVILRSPMMKPEYLPPELQGLNLRTVDRTRAHHNFAVAVLIYRMIMNGTHPYDAVGHPASQPEARILAGVFPHAPGARYAPSPLAPSFETLAPELRGLFLRAFHAGHRDPDARPTIDEWAAALGREVDQPFRVSLGYRLQATKYRVRAAASALSGMGIPVPGKRWAIAVLIIAIYAATIAVTAALARGGRSRESSPTVDARGAGSWRDPDTRIHDGEPALVRDLRAEIRAESAANGRARTAARAEVTTIKRVARWLDPRGYLPGGAQQP